jgi:hypothetical protein
LAADEESATDTRFFLPKAGTNGNSFELGREVASEGEARVEALKLGVTTPFKNGGRSQISPARTPNSSASLLREAEQDEAAVIFWNS